jgi:hypothetical protein
MKKDTNYFFRLVSKSKNSLMEQHMPSQQSFFFFFTLIAFEQLPSLMDHVIGHHPEDSERRVLN